MPDGFDIFVHFEVVTVVPMVRDSKSPMGVPVDTVGFVGLGTLVQAVPDAFGVFVQMCVISKIQIQ